LKSYNIKRGWYLLIVLSLLGCHQSSKVVSSFGKRKYTKGHFFVHPKSVPESPVIVSKTPRKDILKNTPVPDNTIIPLSYRISLPALKNLPGNAVAVTETTADPAPIAPVEKQFTKEDGIPDHNQTQGNTNTTSFGLIGFILAIAVPALLLLSGVAAPLSSVAGLCYLASLGFCIVGLCVKTEPSRGFALAGLIIDIVDILVALLFILLLVALLGA